ncbi:hypothetical protein [Christiangramia sp. SM2212]|uniref:Lipoprotein n=1 Tax=Christiangramia sediminicola TaxID=3073267 RepID=A0ABU1ESN7_9FLAO|nr:hypothetical protein [Christiangramia sp. SM2212]MDR5591419.1 hypothetical protein [Christiangramia sp. SM2212]
MKRLFVLALSIIVSSCSLDNDTPNTYYELAEIVGNDLPEELVFGETYNVEVDYLLPSECNIFQALDARRGGNTPNERRDIYISVVTSVVTNDGCDPDIPGGAGSSKFSITIDQNEPYTFYFWTGVSGTDPVYNEVIIPVVESETPTES